MNSIFTYKGLIEFYNKAANLAPVIAIRSWNRTDKVIMMRHDVDLDVRPAYNMFQIEKDCNIKSSYFFLTSCHSYNPQSISNRNMIREISDKGFEVGLHFDPLIYAGNDMNKALKVEVDIIEQITGVSISSVSLHNPSMHGQYINFENLINVYNDPYFIEAFYLADSRMGFRGKDPMLFLEKVSEGSLQILLHPLHFTKEGHNYLEIMKNYFHDFLLSVDHQFRPNNLTYKDQVDINQYKIK